MYIDKIKAMHDKFGISFNHLGDFSVQEKHFRTSAMLEEVSEFLTADKPEDELDAMVDLVVFALGTVERMGHADVFEEAYSRVMASNMSKTLGPNQKRGSFSLDLQKPADFKPADLSDLVEK